MIGRFVPILQLQSHFMSSQRVAMRYDLDKHLQATAGHPLVAGQSERVPIDPGGRGDGEATTAER
jgi:hypothetical protein